MGIIYCQECEGSGWIEDEDGDEESCPNCGGSGTVEDDSGTIQTQSV